jgi:hypothetical protein
LAGAEGWRALRAGLLAMDIPVDGKNDANQGARCDVNRTTALMLPEPLYGKKSAEIKKLPTNYRFLRFFSEGALECRRR